MDVNSYHQTAPLYTFIFDHLYTLRRMHTSRMYMRNAIPPIAGDMRIVCCCHRGGSAWEGVCSGGVSLPGGVSACRGVSARGIVWQTTPVDRILDTCLLKHHFSATSFVDGNKCSQIKDLGKFNNFH